ncbi:MAG TPA: hypothetical protein VIV58_28270 [Kofleriaceae bacterium]
MTGHQRKLLLSAGGALIAMLIATFAMAWFQLTLDITADTGLATVTAGGLDSAHMQIGLHAATACFADGGCASTSLDNLRGVYPSLATYTFWMTLAVCALVSIQAGLRLLTSQANGFLTRGGYTVCALAAIGAVFTAFVFAPETAETTIASVTVTRTWAPVIMLFGYALAAYALYLAVGDDGEPVYQPITVVKRDSSDSGKREPVKSEPIVPIRESRAKPAEPSPQKALRELLLPLPADPPPRAPSEPKPDSFEIVVQRRCPTALEQQLHYATLSATFTTNGIEAVREDGSARSVAWGDVVGVVARRLPGHPPFDGVTFVDLVSLAGATLRILPWTNVGGELALPADVDGAERARAFVQLIAARCPGARLDSATRTFLGSRGPAAQLSTELLAAHDDRLA